MTDVPSSPDDTDAELLASLYVDGEATPEERAQVEADPELMALVEVYRAQAVALADVTPPAAQRTAQLAAAMDLFDEIAGAADVSSDPSAIGATATRPTATSPATTSSAAEPATVSSLADGRRRRERRRQERVSRGLPTWLGAAAGLVLVVGGLGFVASNLGSSDDDTAEVAINPSSAARNESDAGSDDAADDGGDSAMELSAESDAMASDLATEAAEEAEEEEAAEESFDDAMEDDAAEEDSTEEAAADEEGTGDADPVGVNPVDLDGLAGDTAADYLVVLADAPRVDTDDSDCADAVRSIADTDGFITVIFQGEPAELHALVPEGAVIMSPACEIVLE